MNTEDLPRVFSFEDAREGKRRFLVSSFASFWANYVHTQLTQRHVYEIIREGVPCRLYFDLGSAIAGGVNVAEKRSLMLTGRSCCFTW